MAGSQDRSGDESDAPERSITGAAFWALIDRWRVADEQALALIGGPPRPASGKRPRFRLAGAQVDRYELLRAIDRHLEDLRLEPAPWLATRITEKPFGRKTPAAFMAAGGPEAVALVLHYLERLAFKASLTR